MRVFNIYERFCYVNDFSMNLTTNRIFLMILIILGSFIINASLVSPDIVLLPTLPDAIFKDTSPRNKFWL